MRQLRRADVIRSAILEFLRLAIVPVLHGAVIAGDAAVDLCFLAAEGADRLLAREIPVVLTDRVGRRQRVIRQAVILRDLPDKGCRRLPVRQLFTEEGMEYRAGGVQRLQLILYVKRGENILRIADRQVAGVRVVRCAVFVRRDDVGIELLIMLGKAVCGGLGRRGLQIVEVAILLLIIAQPLPHMVQYVFGKRLRLRVGQIFPEPFRVQPRLIHADKADRRKMILKRAEIASGIGVEAALHQLRDDRALGLERTRSNVHQLVEPPVEIRLIFRQIGDARQVDRHHADRAGRFAGAEEAAGLFAQLPQVEPQAAAHGAHVVRLHIRVDVVGEIRRAVLRRHFKEELVVFRLAPIEILGDGIGRNGILEAASVRVALDHQLDEGFVHHVHFLLALAVGERLLTAADDGRKVCHILRHRPVERDVGKRCLRTPARRRIDTVDERLHALLDLTLRQFIHADEGREIGVK